MPLLVVFAGGADGTVEVGLELLVGVALPGVPACASTAAFEGSIDVPGPVTSAPFDAASARNPAVSGVWMFATARATSPPDASGEYPTAPGGGSTMPIPVASRSIR